MPSNFMEVMAAPGKDDSSTRRRAFPSVSPKPLGRGSMSKRPKSWDI
jgi:hypothetical protein